MSIELANPNGRIALPREGAIINPEIGYGASLVSQGEFEVEEISGAWGDGDTMTITGKAAGKKSFREIKSRPWNEKTISEIATKIAGEHGYTPAIDGDIGSIKISDEPQSEESDQNYLHRIAKKYGGLFSVKKQRLVMIKRGGGKSATGKDMATSEYTRHNTINGTWTLKPRAKFGTVKATYQDRDKVERKEVEIASGDGPSFTVRTPHKTEAEAKAAAQAKSDELKRGEGQISIIIEGDENLQPEGKANVSGIDAGANGKWTKESIDHELSFEDGELSGFVTSINCEKGK